MDKRSFCDILTLFESNTITMLDDFLYYHNDCSKASDYPIEQVYFRLALYLYFSSGKSPSSEDVFSFILKGGYPNEDMEIITSAYDSSSHESNLMLSKQNADDVLRFFKQDTIELINCVINDNPEDYHFSAVMVYKRVRLLLQYWGEKDISELAIENYVLGFGFDPSEVDYIRKRKEEELKYYHGSY